MPKSRPPYDVEFRRRVVELVRSGKAIEALSREFGPTSTSIRNWVRQADLDEGVRKDGLTSDEKAELTTNRGRRRDQDFSIRPNWQAGPGIIARGAGIPTSQPPDRLLGGRR